MKSKSKKYAPKSKIVLWQVVSLIGLLAMIMVVFVSLIVSQNSQELRSSAFEAGSSVGDSMLQPKAARQSFERSQLAQLLLQRRPTEQGFILAVETDSPVSVSRAEITSGSTRQLLQRIDGVATPNLSLWWSDVLPKDEVDLAIQFGSPTKSKISYALLPRPIGRPVVVVPGPELPTDGATRLYFSNTTDAGPLLSAGLSSFAASGDTATGWWQAGAVVPQTGITDGVWLEVTYAPFSVASWQVGPHSSTGDGATLQLNRDLTRNPLPVSVAMPDEPVCVGLRLLGKNKDLWIGTKTPGAFHQTTLNKTLNRGVYTLEARGYSDEACSLVTSKQTLNLIVTN